jgi:hypothetical protein
MEKVGYYTVATDGRINARITIQDHQNIDGAQGKIIDRFAAVSENEALHAFEQRGVTHIKYFEE